MALETWQAGWWAPLALAAGLGLAGTVAVVPLLLPLLRRRRVGQSIRPEGPAAHQAKAGTPTMGGLAFIAATVAATLLWGPFGSAVAAALLLFVGHGLLGWLDDELKVARRRSLGLPARYKLLGQTVLAALLVWTVEREGLGSWVQLPFVSARLDLGRLYPLLVWLIVLAASNAVNLTDGLDGLLSATTLPVAAAYAWIAVAAGQAGLAVSLAALFGGLLGFLVFNRHPARIFMGDTGSLAVGGLLAAAAVLTKTELYLPLIGGVYVLEALSVIVQVASFQLTGRRVLRMSPLHHHLELGGLSENEVVGRFMLLSLLGSALGLFALWLSGGW
ncbi:MAG: phospho-N-acetylmuramoyl-pentapeptide-transferase [Clostridia bacterium]|nr:phospho-N-acetylmuramoyl-pentapeptide-transferase [Clostridia bacterium]MCL6521493.1 phospho-N-acetylmuramoyl-pentapeptide-transferase [Bacillota bacterium]